MPLQEVKERKKNLAMEWIDYLNAYEMVPHSLKYDGHDKNCGECFRKNDEVLEG